MAKIKRREAEEEEKGEAGLEGYWPRLEEGGRFHGTLNLAAWARLGQPHYSQHTYHYLVLPPHPHLHTTFPTTLPLLPAATYLFGRTFSWHVYVCHGMLS